MPHLPPPGAAGPAKLHRFETAEHDPEKRVPVLRAKHAATKAGGGRFGEPDHSNGCCSCSQMLAARHGMGLKAEAKPLI
jgi:hypothetical protein